MMDVGNQYQFQPEWTEQRVFDTVVNHLMRQGVASADLINRKCLYRGPGGASCAVGCLMAEDEYHPDLEGKAASSLDFAYFKLGQSKPAWLRHVELLSALQHAHDHFMPRGKPNRDLLALAAAKLADIAKRRDLTLPPSAWAAMNAGDRAFYQGRVPVSAPALQFA